MACDQVLYYHFAAVGGDYLAQLAMGYVLFVLFFLYKCRFVSHIYVGLFSHVSFFFTYLNMWSIFTYLRCTTTLVQSAAIT